MIHRTHVNLNIKKAQAFLPEPLQNKMNLLDQ
jgi:hypothetical protein